MSKLADEQETLSDSFNWDEDSMFDFGDTAPTKTKAVVLKEQIEKADIEVPPAKKPAKAEKPKDDDNDGDEDEDEDDDTVDPEELDADLFNFDDPKPDKKAKAPAEDKSKAKVTPPAAKDNDADAADNSDDDGDDADDDTEVYTALVHDLKTEGVFDLELKENDKFTKDQFFEKFDEQIDNRVDEAIDELFAEIKKDPTAAAFIKFMKDGGEARKFFQTYSQAPSVTISPDIDLTKEANQKKVVKYYLQTVEHLDAAEADERVEWLEEKGRLADNSEKLLEKMNKAEEKAKAALLKAQEDAVTKSKEDSIKFKTKLQDTLDKTDSVGKFKFNPKDKKSLVDTLTKYSVKNENGQYVTPFMAKWSEASKDPKKLLLMAKLLSNDFDVSDLVTEAETVVTRQTKNKIIEAKKSKNLSNNSSKQRDLADYF